MRAAPLALAALALVVVAAGGEPAYDGSGSTLSGAVQREDQASAPQPPTSLQTGTAGSHPGGSTKPDPAARKLEQLTEFVKEDEFKNYLALFWMPDSWRAALPHVVQSWLRNWIMVQLLYYGLGMVWIYYTYYAFGAYLFKPGEIPDWGSMLEQMKVATIAMPMYAMLPVFNEYCIERGWTRAYTRVSDVGLPMYVVYTFAYMLSVEYFVYWSHRLLHDITLGYKWLHVTHHKYNKEHTMSPFAGLAFNPIDGIIQAIPYTFMLWFVPVHFLTQELLLFGTGIWTNNIHDNIDGKVEPVMGARYHTIHHTMYNKNYGHYFTFVDRLHGTLLTPTDYDAMMAAKAARAAEVQVDCTQRS